VNATKPERSAQLSDKFPRTPQLRNLQRENERAAAIKTTAKVMQQRAFTWGGWEAENCGRALKALGSSTLLLILAAISQKFQVTCVLMHLVAW
jgi:hypothetical protein